VYLAKKKFATTPRAFSLYRVAQYRSVDRYYFLINETITGASYLSRAPSIVDQVSMLGRLWRGLDYDLARSMRRSRANSKGKKERGLDPRITVQSAHRLIIYYTYTNIYTAHWRAGTRSLQISSIYKYVSYARDSSSARPIPSI